MAKAPTSYAGNLARAIGQGVTFGFGDELEAGVRSLIGDRSYDEEVGDIRKSISEFRDTNPIAAYGSEIVGSIPTGVGLAGLALRGGLKGAAKIGALEGSIYGAGEGEGVTGTATSAALGTGLGAAGGKVGEKVFEGIAPLVGKFMKTRGSGAEVKGSGAAELEASPSDLGPLVREAGSDEFVPLEKKVGAPGTSGVDRSVINNPLHSKEMAVFGDDYSPLESVLLNAEETLGMGKKGFTGEQMASRLKNAGIKNEELEASGIASFINENKTVRRSADDYLEYYNQNAPKIGMEINANDVAGGSQQIVNLPPGMTKYEELVFFDQGVRNNPDFSPAATPYNLDHFRFSTQAPIGMARVNQLDDPITGGKATIGGEYQSDLTADLTRQARGEETGVGENLVELTPELVRKFKGFDEKIQDHPKFKTLPDINNQILTIDSEMRSAGALVNEAQRRASDLEYRFGVGSEDPTDVVRDANSLIGISIGPDNQLASPSEKLMAGFNMIDRATNASKAGVYESMPLIKEYDFSDDVVSAATDLGLRKVSTESLDTGDRAAFIQENEAVLKQILGIPADAKVVGDMPRGLNTVQAVAFGDNQRKIDALAELVENVATQFRTATFPTASMISRSSEVMDNIVPKATKTVKDSMKQVRSTHEDYLKARDDMFKVFADFDSKKFARDKASKERRDIINDAVDDTTESATDSALYKQYKYETEGDIAGLADLTSDSFSSFDLDARFVPKNPFKTNSQAIKYQVNRAIKHAVETGSDRYYFPDYLDIAEVPDRLGNAIKKAQKDGDIERLEKLMKKRDAYKATYQDVPDTIIKELQRQYPDLKTGTVDPKDLGYIGESDIPAVQATRPMRYIDLAPMKGEPGSNSTFAVRRYKDGGKVDLRSGIGDIFKVYS